jgi:hypothetical protein
MWIFSDKTYDAISIQNSGEGGVRGELKSKKFGFPLLVKYFRHPLESQVLM